MRHLCLSGYRVFSNCGVAIGEREEKRERVKYKDANTAIFTSGRDRVCGLGKEESSTLIQTARGNLTGEKSMTRSTTKKLSVSLTPSEHQSFAFY